MSWLFTSLKARITTQPVNTAFIALTIASVVVFGVLLVQKKLDGEGAAALIVVIIIAALLAVGGQELLDRIVKLGPLELSAPENLPQVEGNPAVTGNQIVDISDASPWTSTQMTSREKWQYEQETILLAHLRQRGQLTGAKVKGVRGRIFKVGEAALHSGDFAKGLDLLRLLEPLPDKTARELLSIGMAYFWTGLEQREEPPYGYVLAKNQLRHHLEEALRHLEDVSRLDPSNAIVHWTIGYVCDELERFPEALSANARAKEADLRFLPWANWHIAVSLLKMAKQEKSMGRAQQATAKTDEAIKALREIPSGFWWNELWEDDELEDLRKDRNYVETFKALYNSRKS